VLHGFTSSSGHIGMQSAGADALEDLGLPYRMPVLGCGHGGHQQPRGESVWQEEWYADAEKPRLRILLNEVSWR